jgi:hypothetical protein
MQLIRKMERHDLEAAAMDVGWKPEKKGCRGAALRFSATRLVLLSQEARACIFDCCDDPGPSALLSGVALLIAACRCAVDGSKSEAPSRRTDKDRITEARMKSARQVQKRPKQIEMSRIYKSDMCGEVGRPVFPAIFRFFSPSSPLMDHCLASITCLKGTGDAAGGAVRCSLCCCCCDDGFLLPNSVNIVTLGRRHCLVSRSTRSPSCA